MGSAEGEGPGREGLCPPNIPTPDGRAEPEEGGGGRAPPELEGRSLETESLWKLKCQDPPPQGLVQAFPAFNLTPPLHRQPDANEPSCCRGSASLSSCWGPSHRSRHP